MIVEMLIISKLSQIEIQTLSTIAYMSGDIFFIIACMYNLAQQKGRVIKLGDSMESRKSRTTSHNASPGNTSGGQSPR